MSYPKENITTTWHGPYRVRVWSRYQENFDHVGLKEKIWLASKSDTTPEQLAELIASWPNTAAVEVVSGLTDGVVFYPEWP